MSITVDVATDGERVPLARARVAEIARTVLRAEKARDALVSITFVSPRRIATLNARHLRHRGPTDVISFGFQRAAGRDPVIGDIYIAPAVARENARTNRVGVREEIARLVVHGVLHVLGHDHADVEETTAMRAKELALLVAHHWAGRPPPAFRQDQA